MNIPDIRELMDEAKGGNHLFTVDLEQQTVVAPSGRTFSFEIDENRIKQMGQLVGQERLAHTTLTGVAHSDVDCHIGIIAL